MADTPEIRYARRDDGVSIAYIVFGEGPIDLVYVPGFISHLELMWADPGYARMLRRIATFARVICFDKPGTGLSDPLDHIPTVEERAGDIRCVLDSVGSHRTALMGFSEGGTSCILFAATWPERVTDLLVYGSGARFAIPTMEEAAEVGLDPADYPARKAVWEANRDAFLEIHDHWGEGRAVELFAPSVTSALQRRLWATYERSCASPGMARGLVEAVLDIDITPVLPVISVPTLILHRVGDVVPIECGRLLAKEIPGAKLVELPGDDHAFWLGEMEPILGAVEEFVTGERHAVSTDRVLATVLFSDIVGSTELASKMGDGVWRQLLERHDDMVRTRIAAADGRLIKTMGDGFLALFEGPARAIHAAEDVRDAARSLGLELRQGVHTGECEIIGEDVGGMAIHIGARVAAIAAPGEIAVSGTVRDLVVGSRLQFSDRGTHALKGVPGEWRVYAVGEERAPAPEITAISDHMTLGDRTAVRLARRAPGAMRFASRLTGGRVKTAPV